MPLALLALAVGAFGIGTTEFVMMGLLPEVADDLHISIPTAGHLVSAYALGVVIGAPLLAAATARMSRRKVLVALMVLFVAGNAFSAFAPDYHWLVAARFLSGLPHGAFFGVGAVVATSLVAPERKARSVSLMFLGLTVANIAGVPVATLMGQHLGWRATFLGVSAIGVAAIASLALLIPRDGAEAPAGGLRGELAALRSLPVWLALGTTVAGFGALFSAYSYITPMLTDAAGYSDGNVTLLLALFGVGATAGNLVGGRLADHSLRGTLFGGLAALVAVLALFPVLMTAQWSAAVAVTLLGVAAFITGSPLQLMVMEKASAAPSLASSANQAAFNLANAGGAWVGGLALAAGFGATSPAPAGAALAVLGLAVAAAAYGVDRRRAAAGAATPGRLVAAHVPASEEHVHH
ncbi:MULTISPECIES: MFS transporter [Streptomyces]|uniref:MFS transporter n=1 Tax=Streptomyces dengpaensis TaxID=2049881 RepID=A0ABM6SWE2_9ACTN|nr:MULTISPECIES: MFS transporter [Streptomyces]AVH59109.1 MFS transporter [Streptomyces dengpaensis]PIB08602.1 MFS transporter [Streptomyces sp. HG99]